MFFHGNDEKLKKASILVRFMKAFYSKLISHLISSVLWLISFKLYIRNSYSSHTKICCHSVAV
jgi:hypothetical protein